MVVRVVILIVIIAGFVLTVGYFFSLFYHRMVKEEDYTRGSAMVVTQEQLHFSAS